jgi:DNA uptake protein ComE-like DNA-binding protein
MARDSSTQPDAWLPEGAKPRSRKHNAKSANHDAPPDPKAAEGPIKNASANPSEWAAADAVVRTAGDSRPPAKVAPNGDEPSGPKRDEIALKRRIEKLEGDLATATTKLAEMKSELSSTRRNDPKVRASKRLEKAERTIKEQKEERAEFAKKIRSLETQLRSRDTELTQTIEELKADLAEARKAKPEPAADRRASAKTAQKPRRARGSRSNDARDLNGISFEELRNLGLSVTQSARLIAYRDVRGGYESFDELDEVPGLPRETRSSLRAQLTLSS